MEPNPEHCSTAAKSSLNSHSRTGFSSKNQTFHVHPSFGHLTLHIHKVKLTFISGNLDAEYNFPQPVMKPKEVALFCT